MFQRYYIFLLIGLISGTLAVSAYGQRTVICVVDERSNDVIPFANVCLEGLKNPVQKHLITGMDGKVTAEINDKTKIAISYIGYTTYFDTILPGKAITVYLKPTILRMDEVVITAQYAPEKADKSIYRINVINAREIEQKGATNLEDLMKTELNMRVSQSGVLGSNLSLQGLGGQYIKFLIDGVPVVGRMNGDIDLNQLNLNNVDHVEVIEGPMSIIYGSNALAGAINIITKENKSAALSAQVDSYLESVGVYNFSAGISRNINKHQFSLDGGRNFFGGYSPEDTCRSKVFKPRRQLFANTYYKFNTTKFKAKVSGEYFDELLLFKGNLIAPLMINAFDSYFTTRRYSIKTDLYRKINENIYTSLLASYSGYDRIKKSYFKDLTTLEQVVSANPEDRDTTAFDTWMARGMITLNKPDRNMNFQAGFDLNVEKGIGKRISGHSQEIGDYALFMSMKWNPTPKLTLQPGLRVIYNTKYNAPLVYALSSKYDFNKKLGARLSYSRGFRSPDVKELYLYFVDINHNVKGNPNLLAETSDNFNTNISYHNETKQNSFSAEFSGFYNRIVNSIDLIYIGRDGGSSPLYSYINIGRKESKGFNLDFSAGFYPKITVKAGFGETGVVNILQIQNQKKSQTFWSPAVNTEIVYKPFKMDLSLSLFYKYTGKSKFLYPLGTTIAEGWIHDYHTLDITMSKSFLSKRIKVSTGAKNILDNTTIAAIGSSGGAHSGGSGAENLAIAWGRTYFIKVSFIFNKYN